MTAVAYPAVVLGDLLAAAADDFGIPLTPADARRLATHTVELAALAGYRLIHEPGDRP